MQLFRFINHRQELLEKIKEKSKALTFFYNFKLIK